MSNYKHLFISEKFIKFTLKDGEEIVLRLSEINRIASDYHNSTIICYDGSMFKVTSDIDEIMGLLKC